MKAQKRSCVGSTRCVKSDLERSKEKTKLEPDPLNTFFCVLCASNDFRLVSLTLCGALFIFVIVPSLRSTRQEYSPGERGDSRSHEHASSALA
jgi:hypothetical protein